MSLNIAKATLSIQVFLSSRGVEQIH